jgi:hypothetical protein
VQIRDPKVVGRIRPAEVPALRYAAIVLGLSKLLTCKALSEGFRLGHVLVQAVPVPKRGSIVKCLFEAVKDAARRCAVASPSLTAPNRRAVTAQSASVQACQGS